MATLETPTLNGVKLDYSLTRGRVAGLRCETRTHVSGNGDNRGVSISTHHTHHTEFFIVVENGTEQFVRLNQSLSIREGQSVTAIYLKGVSWILIAIVNHSSGRWTEITSPKEFCYDAQLYADVRKAWFPLSAMFGVVFFLGFFFLRAHVSRDLCSFGVGAMILSMVVGGGLGTIVYSPF